MDRNTVTKLLASVGMLFSIAVCLYILNSNSTNNSIIDLIFFTVWASGPYIFSMKIGTVKGKHNISNTLICISIVLGITLFALFYGAGTLDWALMLIPIYQFIVILPLWGLMHLVTKNK
jgi:hypothetical protein